MTAPTATQLDTLLNRLDRRTPAEADRLRAGVQQMRRDLAELRTVARGYCPHCGRGDAAPTVEDWDRERQRADQLAALAHDILYTSHITGDRIARWREQLAQITDRAGLA